MVAAIKEFISPDGSRCQPHKPKPSGLLYFMTLPFLKTNNYFIDSEGFVIKIINGREEIVVPFKSKKGKFLMVRVNDKHYNLLYIMVQHFLPELKISDNLKYRSTRDSRIPVKYISTISDFGNSELSYDDKVKIHNFKCKSKSAFANSRSKDKITFVEVYKTLCMHNFKCVYCGVLLPHNNWHLDHFNSLSNGGRNVLENIVPACSVCNIMKGPLEGNQFYVLCKKVTENYLFKSTVNNLVYTSNHVTNA